MNLCYKYSLWKACHWIVFSRNMFVFSNLSFTRDIRLTEKIHTRLQTENELMENIIFCTNGNINIWQPVVLFPLLKLEQRCQVIWFIPIVNWFHGCTVIGTKNVCNLPVYVSFVFASWPNDTVTRSTDILFMLCSTFWMLTLETCFIR